MAYLTIIIAVLLLFIIGFVYQCKKVTPTDIDIDPDYEDMACTYYFKHPCGAIIEENGKRKHFNYFEAQDYALNHPYYYVKSYTDEHWQFAETYFKDTKKC